MLIRDNEAVKHELLVHEVRGEGACGLPLTEVVPGFTIPSHDFRGSSLEVEPLQKLFSRNVDIKPSEL